jgi:acyl-CoA synthetase (AMP-forming)/AMP-acid ligase II
MTRPVPFSSLGEFVDDLAVLHPDEAAFRFAGRTFTRGDVAARARAIAAGWRAAGYLAGDVVGIVGDGGPAFAIALFSAARAGLVPLLLDPRLTADEVQGVVALAEPKAFAVCGRPAWADGGSVRVFAFDLEGCPALRPRDAQAPLPLLSDPHRPAVMLVTSGTSGHPRVVALSAQNLSSNILAGYDAHPCDRGEVFLSLLPASHAFELTNGLIGPLRCVATVVFPESRNPNQILGTVIGERVTRMNVVPAILQMLAGEFRSAPDAADRLDAFRRQMRSIVCGGAPVSPELVRLLVEQKLPLWLGYGLTEASPSVALGRADAMPAGSTGCALPGVDLRVEDETGELQVRGPNVMIGYVGEPGATAATIEDDWLRTGDLARVDADGYLFITGRRRDIIVTSSGLKLSPDAIEAAYRSPMFAEVCAVGAPDAGGGGGEKPHLAVVPLPESGADASAVRGEFLRLSAAAGAHRALAMTLFTSALPRTRTLKVRRDLVKQAVLDRMGS